MRVVLTGSTGGIGSSIANKCKSNGIETIEISRGNCDLATTVKYKNENIDSLIYCAGINNPKPFSELTEKDIQDTLQINALSFIELCKNIKFNHSANIIAIGSIYATASRSGRLAYALSKHALYGAVKTLAIEMSIHNIKVNMISPGFVLTDLTKKNNSQERINFLNETIPLGITEPSDIADLCFFMLQNRNITGQNIIVDGGYSLLGV
jgi:3-oxoacyl-[acyl-carrier protein] reductase